MNKRGLSGVITVVLIILIVLISIAIIWLFVQPSITKILKDNFGEDGDSGAVSCIKLDLKPISCEKLQDDTYNIKVRRGSGEQNIEEIKIGFQFENRETLVQSTTDIPTEYGTKTYNFDLGRTDLDKVDVASIIDGNACGFSGNPVSCGQESLNECTIDEDCELGEQCINGQCVITLSGQPWQDYSKSEYGFLNTFGSANLPKIGPATGIMRLNAHMDTGCPYPPYGSIDLFDCVELSGLNDLITHNVKTLVTISSNSVWAGNNTHFLTFIDPATNKSDFTERRDNLISRFAQGIENNATLKSEWDSLTAEIEVAAEPYGFDRIPGFGMKQEYEQHYKDYLKRTLQTFQLPENYIVYLQIDNEINVPKHYVGTPEEYVRELELAREAIDEFDFQGQPKTLLAAAGVHSVVPLSVENGFEPSVPDFIHRCSNGNNISVEDGPTKKANWVESDGYKFTMASLNYTGTLNDVVDLHTYRTPYDVIRYPKIIKNFLSNTSWGGPQIPISDVHIVSTEFDGVDGRVDGRSSGSYCDTGYKSSYINYTDRTYRVHQSEDLFMRGATGLFSEFEWGMRLRIAHGGEIFRVMGLTGNRVNQTTGEKMPPSFDTPSMYTYLNFEGFEQNFFRGNKTSDKDYYWDDAYFLGIGFVNSAFLDEPGDKYYPAIIAWSRPENYPAIQLEDLWNTYTASYPGEQQIQLWNSEYIDFTKNEFKIFRPNYPLTDQYYLNDDDPAHVEIDKQIETETLSSNLMVSESPRIFIFTQNPYIP